MVKWAYVELREREGCLKRLAFWTITEQGTDQSELFHLTGSKAEDIDVVVTVDEIDVEKQRRALDCYVTLPGDDRGDRGQAQYPARSGV